MDSRLILVLDMRTPGWLVRTKLRLLPTLGPFPAWGVTGNICVDAAGNQTLADTFHVGLCRCVDRRPGSADAFCATDPCPF